MEQLLAEEQDGVTLQNLGRASLQIIHDIKNQLNGLKLYATFLRKRMEKSEQPADQQETVAKLIAGLDRAASDLNVLVQYGRPLELHRKPQVDVQKLMRGILDNLTSSMNGDLATAPIVNSDCPTIIGEFDPAALADALRSISLGAAKSCLPDAPLSISLTQQQIDNREDAVIEWGPVNFERGDPFRSFNGSDSIRMSLAAKIIEAHGGSAEQDQQVLRVCLPLQNDKGDFKQAVRISDNKTKG